VIDAGLFSLLSTAPMITAICETRIYPVVLPDNPQFPLITYQTIVAPQSPTMDTSGQQHWQIQFDCWGRTFPEASGLRAALVKTLNGAVQLMSEGPLLQNAHLRNVSDDFASAFRAWRCMADITFDFNFQF
jgi:hypothetical protein